MEVLDSHDDSLKPRFLQISQWKWKISQSNTSRSSGSALRCLKKAFLFGRPLQVSNSTPNPQLHPQPLSLDSILVFIGLSLCTIFFFAVNCIYSANLRWKRSKTALPCEQSERNVIWWMQFLNYLTFSQVLSGQIWSRRRDWVRHRQHHPK